MPIIGTIASSRQVAAADTGSFFPISSFVVPSGGSAFVEFTNIPQTYTNLQIRVTARSNRANTGDSLYWRLNSDSGTNYTLHSLYGIGSGSVSGDTGINLNYGYYFSVPAASISPSSVFGVGILDIYDYANTNKFKTLITSHGNDTNGAGVVFTTSSLWRNKTQGISSIRIESQNLANISQYSCFSLYGVK